LEVAAKEFLEAKNKILRAAAKMVFVRTFWGRGKEGGKAHIWGQLPSHQTHSCVCLSIRHSSHQTLVDECLIER